MTNKYELSEDYVVGEEIVTKENLNYNVLLFRQLSTIQYYLNTRQFKLSEAALKTLESMLKPYLPKDYKSVLASKKMVQLARLRLIPSIDRDSAARKLDEEFKFEILAYFVDCANDKGFLLDREEIQEI